MSTDDATSTARFGAGTRVQVLLPLALDEAYDYRVPESLTLAEGDFVRVPLGRRELSGVVWGAAEGHVPESRIKDVTARVAAPPLGLAVRRFIAWVAGYTLAPRGAVLRMAMSVPAALTPPRPTIAYVVRPGAATASTTRLTPARRRLLAVLAEGPPRAAANLAREAGVGASVVRDMAAAGLLQAVTIEMADRPPMPDWRAPAPALSPEQAAAASRLEPRVAKGGFHVALLDGVPGAGKTEVYFHAVARALEAGRQVLVMLPEIALGAQWLARFRDRFGATPVEWHSDLTPARRRQAWRWVAEGQARVVVGARSALFLPFPELGLIVVDEEHDPSFKQEEGVVYNARDMAVVRGRLEDVPVVLVSATPSLESVVNVQGGRYRGLHLPDRFAGALLPAVDLVDMRGGRASARTWLSPELTAALAETLANREQAMLFLNRRGYAPLTLCRACGHRIRCPSCTAWLVEHRRIGRLQCHHCGYTAGLPDACPACNQRATLAACGPGVERLAEEVAAGFPDARLAIAASDTLTGPGAAAELVRRIEDHDVDVVVGTQIVAKGYHFPLLTLVGVVDADIGLAGGDLRAAERTYQLLYQVAGRAGRADRPGRVLVQTYMPDNAVMRALASGDRDRFLAAEADDRRRAGMPPFGRLAAVVVAGRDEPATDAAARALAARAPHAPGLQVLGPAPAPMALLRGWHRRRLLVKATREVALQPILKDWLAQVRLAGKVRVQVDIDPMSFL